MGRGGQPVFRAFRRKVEEMGGEEYVLGLVVDGVPIARIMEMLHVPEHGVLSMWMFYKWLDHEPGRRERYREAQRMSADKHAENSGQILDDLADRPGVPDSAEVSLAKERSGYRRWLAEVRNRGVYGARVSGGLTVNIGSLHLDALRQAGRKAVADGDAMEVEVTESEAGKDDPVLELRGA